MFVLANTAGASAVTPAASKTTLFVDASGVPSTKNNGGTVTPLLTGPAAAAAYQPLDSDLTGIAGLTYAADKSIYYTGSAWATFDLTAAGRALSGVAGTANTFPYFSAANVVTLGSVTATGLSVLAAANQAAARTAIQAVGLVGAESVSGAKTFTDTLTRSAATGDSIIAITSLAASSQAQLQLNTPLRNALFQVSGSGRVGVYDTTNTRWLWYAENVLGQFKFNGSLMPETTNSFSVGSPTLLWNTIYATNSTINTSDARLKTEPRQPSEAERKAGSALSREPMIWEWLTGDRLHAGPTVQAAIAVMEAHGLDPFAYSFICYDEWEAEPEQWHEWEAEVDPETGKVTREAGRELIQLAREAGNRYSFRKEELLCFMVSALAAENDLQAAKVEALDARLAALEAKA